MADYLLLYANNIPVKGKELSAIYSLEKGTIYSIPNTMFFVIKQMKELSLTELKELYLSDLEVLNEYIDLILSKDLGFLTEEPERFPDLELQFNLPEMIHSAVLEYKSESYDICRVLAELNQLQCKNVELLIPKNISKKELSSIFEKTKLFTLRGIDLLVKFNKDIGADYYQELFHKYPKISSIIICDSPFENKVDAAAAEIFFLKANYQTLLSTDRYNPTDIYINTEYFMESQFYNPYYNNKVTVDIEGNIKNCLFHTKTFGNVNQQSLIEIVQQTSFRELWFACVDKIEGIKDSPLRYAIMIIDELEKFGKNSYRLKSQAQQIKDSIFKAA